MNSLNRPARLTTALLTTLLVPLMCTVMPAVEAAALTIANPSFEDPVTGFFTLETPPGWTLFGTVGA
ncbi:MAG: hypothetical protein ACREXT_14780, partial [Gammaproteobacteria bacterium]